MNYQHLWETVHPQLIIGNTLSIKLPFDLTINTGPTFDIFSTYTTNNMNYYDYFNNISIPDEQKMLKTENQDLRNENSELYDEIRILHEDIDVLKNTNIDMKIRNESLHRQNQQLLIHIGELEEKAKIADKFLGLFQNSTKPNVEIPIPQNTEQEIDEDVKHNTPRDQFVKPEPLNLSKSSPSNRGDVVIKDCLENSSIEKDSTAPELITLNFRNN